MTSVKVKFRSPAANGKGGSIYYQIIHNREVRQVNTGYKISPSEWNDYLGAAVVISSDRYSERADYLASINKNIIWDKERWEKVLRSLRYSGYTFTTDDLIREYLLVKEQSSFIHYLKRQIARLKSSGNIRTSETYTAALHSISGFLRKSELSFEEIDEEWAAGYEAHLKQRGNSPNTLSFYMRIIKAVYNRAVKDGLTEQKHPFKSVYTGVEKTRKRSLSIGDLKKIKEMDISSNPSLDYARDMFLFSFYTRGMSFIDMAYLRKRDLAGGTLTYRRRKTGQTLTIKWEECMQKIIDKYPDNKNEYLLPIITVTDNDTRKQYTNTLHRVNRLLKKIGETNDIKTALTMYCARHSWASIAKYHNIPLSVISEGLGHESETTTLIYLASLNTLAIDNANKKILNLL